MASVEEQRRFLAQIQSVSIQKLLEIKNDLLELQKQGNLTATDRDFLLKVVIELNARD